MSDAKPDEGATNRSSDFWLLVVGMHRSGTSALTGALGALGFKTPHAADRTGFQQESNAEHWESLSLSVYNDELLNELGGSWDAPPHLPPGWESAVTDPTREPPRPVLRAAFPESGPHVWKDPRLCLVFPFWKTLLPKPLAAVLIWRSPLAVARSLETRDGFRLADGIALWERYNRAALENLAGTNTFVCSYEAVVRDPTTALRALADWLGALPGLSEEAAHWDREQSGSSIVRVDTPRDDTGGSDLLLPQHLELSSTLSSLEGGHEPLPGISLTSESDWTSALLDARNGSRTYDLQTEIERKQIALDRLRDSASWRVTKPLRSLTSALRSLRPKPSNS